MLRYRFESSRWGHPSGSSLSQSSIRTTALTTPSWCLVGAFAMRSPLRVEFFSNLDGNEDSSASSLGFDAKPSRWGHPYRVMLHISAHSIGTKASSIHLFYVVSRWGHPLGRLWFSSHSIESKSSLDSWLVFLQDGVILSGQILAICSRLKELPQLGSWERGDDSVCIPLANEGVGLGPSSSSGPVASHPPLASRSASATAW